MEWTWNLNKTSPTEAVNWHIDMALEKEEQDQPPRDYLGGSIIGYECARKAQLIYMRAPKDKEIPGRILRIFARGHWGEDYLISRLRAAGFEIKTRDGDGKQHGFRDGDLAGHADGVVAQSPTMAVKVPALWECKGLGSRWWKKVAKEKVKRVYPQYYGQIQVYQHYLGLRDAPALFTACNMDTMDLYHELVPYDGAQAARLIDKARHIIMLTNAGELAPRIAASSNSIHCKMCDYTGVCWNG